MATKSKKPRRILKCESCGYEQVVNKKFDELSEYELANCTHLYCGCNACKEKYPRVFPPGYVKHDIYPLQWTTILSPFVANALYEKSYDLCGGSWTRPPKPSKEYIESVARAKAILEAALRQKDDE